jgi:transcriptional regulator with XRE-family HTH domain
MERQELKSKVPHGYIEVIAERAGVNRMTVSNFLNGKNDNVKVEMATLEVLAELAEKKNNLIARIG